MSLGRRKEWTSSSLGATPAMSHVTTWRIGSSSGAMGVWHTQVQVTDPAQESSWSSDASP